MTEMLPTILNKRWTLLLPEHRADRGVYPEGTPHAGEPVWDHWESERLSSMYDLLKPGDLVVDVGAEEGDLSALYASWGCRVFLAEPNPKVWPNIRAIFESNELTGYVNGWWVGFFGDSSNLAIRWPDDEPPVRSIRPSHDGWPPCASGPLIGDHGFLNLSENDNPERVTPCCPIDAQSLAPTAITIDVEGSELRVLRGAVETIRRHRPIIWVSVHPEMMQRMYGDSDVELGEYLIGLGYYGQMLADVHEQHWVWRYQTLPT